jgi:hypothetical protein
MWSMPKKWVGHVEHGEEMGGACGAWRRNGWGMWSTENKWVGHVEHGEKKKAH